MKRLPFGFLGEKMKEMSYEEANAVCYLQIHKRVKKDENFLKSGIVFWPVTFIQGEPHSKLMLDNVGLFHLEEKLINSPRTPQIGHILRNPDLEKIEKIDLINRLVQYKEDINLDENGRATKLEEIIQKKIEGICNPDILELFSPLISKSHEFTEEGYACLDSIYNFDTSMNFAQDWFNTVNDVHGNIERWKNLKKMIEEPVERWILDLEVEKKDIQERKQKKISELAQFNEIKLRLELDKRKDSVESWVTQEYKGLSEKIGKMFMGIDMILTDLRKQNKFFLDIDVIRTKPVDEVLSAAENHVEYTKKSVKQVEDQLAILISRINEIKAEFSKVGESAKEQVEDYGNSLNERLSQQADQIKQITMERDKQIVEIQSIQNKIQSILDEIKEYIEGKIKHCHFNEIKLRRYQINDTQTKITTPTAKFYIPVGVGLIEDEEDEERIEILFLGTMIKNEEFIPLNQEVYSLEHKISAELEGNMRLKSNFEFTLESLGNNKRNLQSGMNSLLNQGYIKPEKYEDLLKKIS